MSWEHRQSGTTLAFIACSRMLQHIRDHICSTTKTSKDKLSSVEIQTITRRNGGPIGVTTPLVDADADSGKEIEIDVK